MVKLATLDKRKGERQPMAGFWNGRDIPTRQHHKQLFTGITLVGREAIRALGMTIGRNCIILFGKISRIPLPACS